MQAPGCQDAPAPQTGIVVHVSCRERRHEEKLQDGQPQAVCVLPTSTPLPVPDLIQEDGRRLGAAVTFSAQTIHACESTHV